MLNSHQELGGFPATADAPHCSTALEPWKGGGYFLETFCADSFGFVLCCICLNSTDVLYTFSCPVNDNT